jgi:hypothetical protein
MKNLFYLLSAVAFTFGCSPNSPKLQAPVPKIFATTASGTIAEANTPRVDILVVEDNTDSMTKHQSNLIANIDKFVNGFAKNGTINFHIAVTSIFDSVHYSPNGKWLALDGKTKDDKGRPYVDVLPMGQLYPLVEMVQDPNDKNKKIRKVRTDIPPFITRETPDYLNILRNTLKIGVAIGPQYEESFSPVVAALSDTMVNGPNKGFYRADKDTYFVVIFLTDADDSGRSLSPSGFSSFLKNLKEGGVTREMDEEKIIVAAAIIPSGSSTCKRDPTGEPKNMEQFLRGMISTSIDLTDSSDKDKTPKNFVSLCDSNFGKKLAKLGTAIGTKVGRTVIDLGFVPDESQEFTVWYGDKEIPKDADKGWSFNLSDSRSIIISGNLELPPQPNAKITVHVTPANLDNLRNGRTKVSQNPPSK